MNNRLPLPYGLLIDRNKPIQFSFEGQHISGFQGDTIASAMISNQSWLLSRSFKYHRPRGPLTMAGQDANTLVQLPSDPNALADKQLISENLMVKGQNYSGSLSRDRGAILGLFSRFLPVGFYYKAFFKPRGIWQKWAPFIRKKAGLGAIDTQLQPDYYDKEYLFCDVLVVGAGPAGMQAAIDCAAAGADVLLVEENPITGGSLNYSRFDVDGSKGQTLRDELLTEISKQSNIKVMTDAVCNGWFADNWLPIIRHKRLYKVRAKQSIFCTGAMEQPALFHNNDLPGVVMSSAAQRLLHLYAIAPGSSAIVLTGNNEGYGTALDLMDAGVRVNCIVDLREDAVHDDIAKAAMDRGVKVKLGYAVYAAHSKTGHRLTEVEIRKVLSPGQCENSGEVLSCDLLCMSVGYTPAYQLACQAGGQLSYDDETAMFTLTNCANNVHLCGSLNSVWQLDQVLMDAQRAAKTALCELGLSESSVVSSPKTGEASPNHPWPIFPHPKGKEFVDFDEDLTIDDIVNATADGYEHIQLVKRYSTCGMGPSQGRHSALAAARLVAEATGRSVAETGVTTARPPFSAEQLGHSAGRRFFPARRTNIHYRHLEANAEMLQAGSWYRPAYYKFNNLDKHQCINREVTNVRHNVGLVDVSTLGALEIRGSDAAEFLNRIYTGGYIKQPVGKARYALLTNEAAVVLDDGVACRLGDDHYFVTATTGGVDRVYQSMLKWNAQWQLNIDIANVTSAYCAVNIAGPKARAVLTRVCDDIDLSGENFPYMGIRSGHVAGIPSRLLRVGFVGELGYEIHVPQHCGEALWDALMTAGHDHSIIPFGIEAQRIMRLEKGHVIVGQDTDAMSNANELQMGWAVNRKKPFFVGGRTLTELEKEPLMRALVGFVLDVSDAPTPCESHLILQGDTMIGRVTSCNYSPTLDKIIGLAYVPPEHAKAGSQLTIKSTGGILVNAKVAELPFFDPDNQRQEL
ncbi:2Fe-2S iron-sulfur cluster-binding protein [Porticoccaceae bacterium]|nr:2Fe-2S iron-sulfur cluster-binding protein [Porticoccaceae bacterium]